MRSRPIARRTVATPRSSGPRARDRRCRWRRPSGLPLEVLASLQLEPPCADREALLGDAQEGQCEAAQQQASDGLVHHESGRGVMKMEKDSSVSVRAASAASSTLVRA